MFELLHAPFPEGYGDELLPLAECKAHLRVTSDDEDELISILRDAAIEFVELYCSIKLGLVPGLRWEAQAFPQRGMTLLLAMKPVSEITSIEWLDRTGVAVAGDPASFRVSPTGSVQPSIGDAWPGSVGGSISIEFTAGYPAGQAPRSLLMAAKMFLGHLWAHREAVLDSGSAGEVPFGVVQLCRPFRAVRI